MAEKLTFEAWQSYHGTLFGLCTKAHALMVVEIGKLFASYGYTPEEMFAASKWLSHNNPPTYPNEHLPRLQARLRELRYRRELLRREADAQKRRDQERNQAIRGKAVRKMIQEAQAKGVL